MYKANGNFQRRLRRKKKKPSHSIEVTADSRTCFWSFWVRHHELLTKRWQLDCTYLVCVCFRGRSSIFTGLLGWGEEDAVLLACCCPRSERRRKGPSLERLSLPKCGPAQQGQRFETAGDQGNDDVMRNLKYMVIDMHQWSVDCPTPTARASATAAPAALQQTLFSQSTSLLLALPTAPGKATRGLLPPWC